MRVVVSIVCFFIAIGCRSGAEKKADMEPEKTEAQKRRHFAQHFAHREGWGSGYFTNDTGETFTHFMRSNYPGVRLDMVSGPSSHDAFIYAFEENFIDTSTEVLKIDWMRFVVTGRFYLPFCVVLEKKNGRSYLTAKLTNGFMSARTGDLLLQTTLVRDGAYFDSVAASLEEMNYWLMPTTDPAATGGLDGSTWTVEIFYKNRYKRLRRWSPEQVGDSSTRKLGRLGANLWECSGILGALQETRSSEVGQKDNWTR